MRVHVIHNTHTYTKQGKGLTGERNLTGTCLVIKGDLTQKVFVPIEYIRGEEGGRLL